MESDPSLQPTPSADSIPYKWTNSEGPDPKELAFREYQVMLRYALAEGILVEPSDDITAVEEARTHFKDIDFTRLLSAHAKLAKIVAPATPSSLEATEPEPGFLGSFRRPPLIWWTIIFAVLSALGFVLTTVESVPPALVPPTKPGAGDKSKVNSWTVLPAVRIKDAYYSDVALLDDNGSPAGAPVGTPFSKKQLNWFFSAALGASFYVLFTAHEYVKNRTFDPRYNSVYLVRLVLGILAGLILANLAPVFSDKPTFQRLGPEVVALLGGYSSEAVNQVLQRLVEIMLAAVRGDNSAAIKTKVAQTAQQELLALAADPNLSQGTRDKVHEAIQRLGK